MTYTLIINNFLAIYFTVIQLNKFNFKCLKNFNIQAKLSFIGFPKKFMSWSLSYEKKKARTMYSFKASKFEPGEIVQKARKQILDVSVPTFTLSILQCVTLLTPSISGLKCHCISRIKY